MKKSTIKLSLVILAVVAQGCATTGKLGDHDQFKVHRDTGSFFGALAPSVTIVEDLKGNYQVFAGPSAGSQVFGLAGQVATGYMYSQALKQIGPKTYVNQTGANSSASNSAKVGPVSATGGDASAHATGGKAVSDVDVSANARSSAEAELSNRTTIQINNPAQHMGHGD
jgi:hypothetical protein